jgi:type I restriction enzyme M protein
VYFKKYHDSSIIEVDCEKKDIIYLNIECESKTTSNFSQPENFVVLECVDRLLDK